MALIDLAASIIFATSPKMAASLAPTRRLKMGRGLVSHLRVGGFNANDGQRIGLSSSGGQRFRHQARSLRRKDGIAGGRFSLDRHELAYGSSGNIQFPARFMFRLWTAEIEKAADVAATHWPESGGGVGGRAEMLRILSARQALGFRTVNQSQVGKFTRWRTHGSRWRG